MPRDPAGPRPHGTPTGLEPLAQHALRGWLALGVSALAVAGVLAVLLGAARWPGAETWNPWVAQDAFDKVLVSHVVLAFVLWFWAMLGALAVAAKGDGRVGLAGLVLACVGALCILVPALIGRGEPALSNYIPVLIDPVFLTGLGLFALGTALPAAQLLVRPPRGDASLATGIGTAGALFILAALCVLLAWHAMPAGTDPLNHVDALFWGGGHILQFAYTALLLTGWQCLGAMAFGEAPLGREPWRILCAILVIAAVPGPLLYIFKGSDPADLRQSFTMLYWYGMPVPVAAMAAATVRQFWRHRAEWRATSWLATALSLAQFIYGGLLGLGADGADTRTPAHYHAEIGGVNLALFGLVFALLLPALGRPDLPSRARRLVLWLYFIGQAVDSAGFFLAGTEGVPRKLAGLAQGLDTGFKRVAMDLHNGGGGIAVIGGVLFIWLALRALLKKAPS